MASMLPASTGDIAPRGIEELIVPLDHKRLFHESNLPTIVNALIEWTSKHRLAPIIADVHK